MTHAWAPLLAAATELLLRCDTGGEWAPVLVTPWRCCAATLAGNGPQSWSLPGPVISSTLPQELVAVVVKVPLTLLHGGWHLHLASEEASPTLLISKEESTACCCAT